MKEFRFKVWIKELISRVVSSIYLVYEPWVAINSPAYQKMIDGGFKPIDVSISEDGVCILMRKRYFKSPFTSWKKYFQEAV